MLEWETIDTVLLDMDGTLLDLNFDNHFWHEFVPIRYAQQNQLTLEQAKLHLKPLFNSMIGKLEWYCLDYWSEQLQLDIIGLKQEVSGLIAILPHVTDFLRSVQQSHRRVMLVTNAHPDGLNLKLDKTCLAPFFDSIHSSHQFGYAKEQAPFWSKLQQHDHFNPERTLLVDDNIKVLSAAQSFGVRHLVSIIQPDTQKAAREIFEYPAIRDFRELLHVV